jgi:hypothetical protein
VIAAENRHFHVLQRLVAVADDLFWLDPNIVNQTCVAFEPSSEKGRMAPRCDFDWINITADLIPFFLRSPVLDLNCSFNGKSIVLVAAATSNVLLMTVILPFSGVDVDIFGKTANTLFILATRSRAPDCLRLLVEHPGTDLNHRDCHRRSALAIAATFYTQDLLTFLIGFPQFDPRKSGAA